MKSRGLHAALVELGIDAPDAKTRAKAARLMGISVRQLQRLLAGDCNIKDTIALLLQQRLASGSTAPRFRTGRRKFQ